VRKIIYPLIAMLLMASIFLPALALADQTAVDNDIYSNGNQHQVWLSAAAGATVSTEAQIIVTRQGGQHLSVGDPVDFTVGTNNLPAGYTVSDVSNTIPSPWDTNGQVLIAGCSTITFTAPATDGGYVYNVKWDETHAAEYGSKLNGMDNFVIHLTVGSGGGPAELPELTLTKTADAAEAHENDTITYTYDVENTGDVALTDVGVSDPDVDDPPGISGPTEVSGNGDSSFDPGEVWEFTAEYTVPWFTAGPVVNTGNATAVYDSTEVWDTDDESVTILHNPDIEVTKSGPDPIGYFQTVNAVYDYTVENTGDCALIVELSDDVYDVLEPVDGDTYLLPGETWNYSVSDTLVCEGETMTVFTNTATATGEDATGAQVYDTACWNVVVFQWLPRTIGYWGNWANHWSTPCITQLVNAVNGNSTYFSEYKSLTVSDVKKILLATDPTGKMTKDKATALLQKQLLATWLSVVSYMGATDGNPSTCGSLDAAMDPDATVYFETGGTMTVRGLLNRIEYNLTTGAAGFGIDGRLLAKDILNKMNNAENNGYYMFMDPAFDPSACP